MNSQATKNLIVVCGPTASGKTRLGVQIALHVNGEIISADSRQVYRGMDIGTGKDLSEYTIGEKQVPYHLIDIADPADVYSVYSYKRDFFRVFKEITERKKIPAMVGGTGLYIEAILRNYDIPGVPEDKAFRDEHMTKDKQLLEKELAECAPDLYQSTDRKSKKRIVRSLEIAKHGTVDKEDDLKNPVPGLRPVVLGVVRDRSRLKERIRERLDARFEQGMVDEVQRLMDRGLSPERLAMFGMEYRHIAGFLQGKNSFEKMSAALLHDIEQLSKRQATWFRGMERRGVATHWIEDADPEKAFEVLDRYEF